MFALQYQLAAFWSAIHEWVKLRGEINDGVKHIAVVYYDPILVHNTFFGFERTNRRNPADAFFNSIDNITRQYSSVNANNAITIVHLIIKSLY
jgi:hypothetical protein